MKIICHGLLSNAFRKSELNGEKYYVFHHKKGVSYVKRSPELEGELEGDADFSEPKPLWLDGMLRAYLWAYRCKVYSVTGVPSDEVALRIKQMVFRQAKAIEKISREVAAFENFEQQPSSSR